MDHADFLATGEEINAAAYFRSEADNLPIAAERILELIKSRVCRLFFLSHRRKAPKFAEYNVRKLFAFNSPHFVSNAETCPFNYGSGSGGGGADQTQSSPQFRSRGSSGKGSSARD